MPTRASILACAAVLMLASCGRAEPVVEDPLLARLHNKELRLSELEGMFPRQADRQDSLIIIRSFTSRWLKDAALAYEAERNLPPDLNIDRLVRDYRASLISSHYEEVLVASRLDSAIQRTELEAYYEENKERYLLERPIVRCYFIRVPYPTEEEELLQDLWNNGKVTDTAALADYCERFAEVYLLREESWYGLDEVIEQLPEGVLTPNNVKKKREFSLQEGSYRYYFRLLEVKPRLEIAPLSYVEDQMRNMILQNRKRKVLEEAREDIYNRELAEKNVEVFDLE